jgi:chromosome segregation ATPase
LEEANVALAELQERDEADKDQIFELVSRENELAEQLELEQRRNIELSQQLTLARKDAERFQCEADTSTSTLEKTLAEISSYQDQQKKNQERESIMFQQINDLTQQKQQAENEVKSCQAKLVQCQKQIINYEKNTLDLQQHIFFFT